MSDNQLKFPTLLIQLRNEQGMPYEMPDDWLETVLSIASMVNAKYGIGIDVLYGMASREGFNLIDKEVNE
tara:strand:- start:669 stop:878 length:210 start_codon:yes stop_codon:yes gene_type:complete